MKIEKNIFPNVAIITPDVFYDKTGYFMETFNRVDMSQGGIPVSFCQDNESYSTYGVIRGLHFQKPPYTQAKLVRVVKGEILDVIVDMNPHSITFGRYFSVVLSAENKKQLFVPEGYAHGFATLSSEAIVVYKCSEYYNKASESGVIYNDAKLNIDWIIPEADRIVSEKDLNLPTFNSHFNK